MPLCVALYKFTDQGRKAIKDSPRRVRETTAAAEKSGAKIHQILYTIGRYDLVAVVEAPSDQVGLAAGLGQIAAGNVVLETLHAYSVEEMEKILSRLP